MTRRPVLVALLASLLVAPALRSEAPPAAHPSRSASRPSGSQRLRGAMQRFVDEGRTAGIVTYVARNGRVAHLEAFGKADVEAGRSMRKDTVFRIASQTKALTSVAVMMLVEEGEVGLADPVSRGSSPRSRRRRWPCLRPPARWRARR
jgi:CubicO group peptidase (beta-lactamase class C family)